MTREGNLNRFKTGINPNYYRRIAFEAHGELCQRCGSDQNIEVHHTDENRHNNDPRNLEVLCKACHMEHHHGLRGRWAKSWDQCRVWDARAKACRSGPL